jgi:ParB-like chromosome segregation protein Spo0J/antitoxin component of MazEF toxin-antitoxin module
MGKLTRRVKYIAKERRLSIPAEFLHQHSIERGDSVVVSARNQKLYVFPLHTWERHKEMAQQVQNWFPSQQSPLFDILDMGVPLRLGSQDRIVLPREFPFQMEESTRLYWELVDGILIMEPQHHAAPERPALAQPVGQASLLDLMGSSRESSSQFSRNSAQEDLIEKISVGRIDHRDHTFSDSSGGASEALIRSIRVEGIRIPLVLRERGDGNYQVIQGFRRLAAARDLQVRSVPAIVWRGLSEADCRRLKLMDSPALGEQEDSPLHRLQSTVRLHEDQVALKEIERITGRRKRTLQRYLRVAQDPKLRDAIESGRLSIFKAEEILKAGVDAEVAIQERWTVKRIRQAGEAAGAARPKRHHEAHGSP